MPVRFKRRKFIQLVGAGAFGSAFSQFAFGQTPYNELKIPPLLVGENTTGVEKYALKVQSGESRFLSGLTTPTIGVNGNYLGPTVRFAQGSNVAVNIDNSLDEVTTLHWHGLHVPANVDGGPAQEIASGTQRQVAFNIMQKAGTFWYHSHRLNKTGEQVYHGMAGMVIIDDQESSALELPATYGVDDIPLIVQDRRFNSDGTFRYISMHRDVMTGVFGDTVLVNGTVSPIFSPTTTLVRFRLLNAANARTFNFAFDDQRSFHVIASDGGLLGQGVKLRNLELAPSERAEILVDFSDGEPANLLSLPIAANSPFAPQGMMRNMHPLDTDAMQILAVVPQSDLSRSTDIPAALSEIHRLSPQQADRVRDFVLSMPMGMGMRMRGNQSAGSRNSGRGRSGMMGNMGSEFLINGRAMDMARIDERVPVGSTEIWRIRNDSMMTHPFHLHHGQFQILDRDGIAPAAHELGYKDTVRVAPGSTVRFIMKFENFPDANTTYMYHCHILEHEDNGMMGQFTVE